MTPLHGPHTSRMPINNSSKAGRPVRWSALQFNKPVQCCRGEATRVAYVFSGDAVQVLHADTPSDKWLHFSGKSVTRRGFSNTGSLLPTQLVRRHRVAHGSGTSWFIVRSGTGDRSTLVRWVTSVSEVRRGRKMVYELSIREFAFACCSTRCSNKHRNIIFSQH